MNPRLRAFVMLSFALELGLAVSPTTRIPAVAWGGAIAVVAGLAWGILASEIGILAYIVADGWLPFVVTDWMLFSWFLIIALVACVCVWAILRGRLAPYRPVWASLREEKVKRDD